MQYFFLSCFETRWFICLGLLSSVLLTFWFVTRCGFVDYDDADYVSANPHVSGGLTWQNVRWAFRTGHASNWHPVTWLSHMLDWQLFRNRPGLHHLTSLGLHGVNTVLLFLLLRRMTDAHWRSALVAALFGLHPLRAESVAWVSERKDVLSALFLLLTLWAYVRFSAAPKEREFKDRRRHQWYVLSLFFFALGLMSKPMLVTGPFLLLLLDYWPLQRFELDCQARGRLARCMVEKLPFVFLAIITSAVTLSVQRKGGAVSTALPFGARVANAFVSCARYLGKTFWPTDLSVLYPHPGHWPVWMVAGSVGLVAFLSIGAILLSRRRPFIFVGWFWFMGGLLPVLGLVQVGIQSMADRYTYIPSIGLFIGLVWVFGEGLQKIPTVRLAGLVAASGCVVLCGLQCAHQVLFWQNSESLFRHAVAVTSDNYLAYNNLGFYLSSKGKIAEAKWNYEKSISINANYPDALNNLGYALAAEKRFSEAIPYYERAVRLSPNQPEIHNNLGNALAELGQTEAAIRQYRTVLEQKPDHADAHNNLGIALAMQGRLDDAILHFRSALGFKPDYASAHSNLGNALAAQRKLAEAVLEYRQALRLNPDDAQAHNNLANALVEQNDLRPAIEEYNLALRLNASNPESHFNLGIALQRIGRIDEAVQHFREALRLSPQNEQARIQLQRLEARPQ